eukprot:PhF_6_TR8476/c0_g1_i1/m.13253
MLFILLTLIPLITRAQLDAPINVGPGVGGSSTNPFYDTPFITVNIAPRGIAEVYLECPHQVLVNRVVFCTIYTKDICGNTVGKAYNKTNWGLRPQWKPVVSTPPTPHLEYKDVGLHSAIYFKRKGMYEFYFTPTIVGTYTLSVQSPAWKTLKVPPVAQSVIVMDRVQYCISLGTMATTTASTLRMEQSLAYQAKEKMNVVIQYPPSVPPSYSTTFQSSVGGVGLQEIAARSPLAPGKGSVGDDLSNDGASYGYYDTRGLPYFEAIQKSEDNLMFCETIAKEF